MKQGEPDAKGIGMMDLLEYQAKALFRSVGIPVLPAQKIEQPRDIKHLTIPYPVVLKSQVYIGGRGRLGGVRFVENTIDAIAAAQAIFNLPILGEVPKVLLAEAKYDTEQEYYLAVALNRSIRRPVLLGSTQGGVDVQSAIESMQQVVVDGAFSPFYARRLVLAMGVEGALINPVSDVVEKMYRLFVAKDLDLLEINPLGVKANGEVMALDGKVTVNDGALGRHADLLALSEQALPHGLAQPPELQLMLDKGGTIGLICNGAGLTMATIDWVVQAQGKPYCFVNIGGETHHEWTPEVFCQRLLAGLIQTVQQPVRAILLNLVTGTVDAAAIGETLRQFWLQRHQALPTVNPTPNTLSRPPVPIERIQVVVRWAGTDGATIAAALAELPEVNLPLLVFQDLDEAIAAVVKASHLKNR
jgi:succinyl-CoA synthetase beta subunit